MVWSSLRRLQVPNLIPRPGLVRHIPIVLYSVLQPCPFWKGLFSPSYTTAYVPLRVAYFSQNSNNSANSFIGDVVLVRIQGCISFIFFKYESLVWWFVLKKREFRGVRGGKKGEKWNCLLYLGEKIWFSKKGGGKNITYFDYIHPC